MIIIPGQAPIPLHDLQLHQLLHDRRGHAAHRQIRHKQRDPLWAVPLAPQHPRQDRQRYPRGQLEQRGRLPYGEHRDAQRRGQQRLQQERGEVAVCEAGVEYVYDRIHIGRIVAVAADVRYAQQVRDGRDVEEEHQVDVGFECGVVRHGRQRARGYCGVGEDQGGCCDQEEFVQARSGYHRAGFGERGGEVCRVGCLWLWLCVGWWYLYRYWIFILWCWCCSTGVSSIMTISRMIHPDPSRWVTVYWRPYDCIGRRR